MRRLLTGGFLVDIDHKCWYYKTAIEAGTESIHSPNWEEEQFSCETYENPAEQPDQTADVELTI